MSRAGFVAVVIALLAPALLAPALLAPVLADAEASQGSGLIFLGPGNVKLVSGQEIPARYAGQLTVDFHGDAASGCAAEGVCAYSGTVVWRPPASGSLEVLGYRVNGHLHYDLDLAGNASSPTLGGVTTASVRLSAPLAATSNCLDATSTGDALPLPLHRGRVAFTLADASPSLLTTRCAGPLESDITSALPAPTLALGAVVHGHITVSLAASSGFSSHGFAGTVQSTLSVGLGKPGRRIPPPSSTEGFPTARYRQIDVTYRARLSGSAVEQIAGDPDAAVCSGLGSCDLSGTVTVHPPLTDFKATMTVIAPARQPARDLLAAVGLSRVGRSTGVVAMGVAGWSTGGMLAAVVNQAGTTCRDTALLGSGEILLVASEGRLGGEYLPVLGDGLRTRCPGPEDDSYAPLATGSVPLDRMRHGAISLTLRSAPSFRDDGYDIRPVAHLTLTLTRARTRTRITVGPAGLP